jgi:broad specificity phosphatase PhoE
MTKILYLVRHGLTDWNVQSRMQGHSNIPLNDTGRAQARTLQDFFAAHPVDHIFSSDLDRAHQTIDIGTARMPGRPPIQKLKELREVNLGAVEGITREQIQEKYGEESWEQWTSLKPHANFAYPGGETHQESLDRSLKVFKHIFENHEFRTAVACTHGLLIRRLAHHLQPERLDLLPIPNCGVFELRSEQGRLVFDGPIFRPEEI